MMGNIFGKGKFWLKKRVGVMKWWWVTVLMMWEMSLDDWDEKSEKKKDQDDSGQSLAVNSCKW